MILVFTTSINYEVDLSINKYKFDEYDEPTALLQEELEDSSKSVVYIVLNRSKKEKISIINKTVDTTYINYEKIF